jgi:hypothetical protein
MALRKIAWTVWALLPVAALAYHFGPGQRAYTEDKAADILAQARALEVGAEAAQARAYDAHLRAIAARREALKSPDAAPKAREAAAAEDAAYAEAAEAWRLTADKLQAAQDVLAAVGSGKTDAVRIAKDRTLIRAGKIGDGVGDLETLLDTLPESEAAGALARQAREELATGYYYGARLMRASGKPPAEWREVSAVARQNFRYLAESSKAEQATDLQKNLELVLNLEQAAQEDLLAKPLPKMSPRSGSDGLQPSNRKGKSKRPPRRGPDARRRRHRSRLVIPATPDLVNPPVPPHHDDPKEPPMPAPFRAQPARLSAVVLLAGLAAAPAMAQVKALPMVPARAAAPAPVSPAAGPEPQDEPPTDAGTPAAAPALPAAGGLTKEEVAELRAQYDALPKDRQEEMKAYYKDLGLDLDVVLGLASAASAEAMRLQELLGAMRDMDFSRTPQNVLAARSKIGFGQVPQPNFATARGADLARWVHLQVMAGEWPTLTAYLASRPKDESQRVYSQVLQSLNRGNSGLLPEEVLAFAEACPEDPKPWQAAAWSAMLRAASEKNSTGPLLAQLEAGTRFFGGGDADRRRRTVDFLAGAGLLTEAYRYLPPLEDARAAGDGDLILVHARYQADLAAKAGETPEAEAPRAAAWGLFTEVSLLDRSAMTARREAIRQAVLMLGRMPRAQVTPWLQRVFANDALGPAALEAIALSAASVADGKAQNEEQRARSILSLKEAVDILLQREGLDQSVLRVPMRMLTTALVVEMENAVAQKGRQRTVSGETQLLIRAIPGKAWLDALEPSLAARAGRACVCLAAAADETDMALTLLGDAVKRSPDQAAALGDAFLKTWQGRLVPASDVDQDTMMYYFWREYVAQAPLTRGRQRRNLDRLARLMSTLKGAGVDPRALPALTPAFKACHALTEVYDRPEVESVFGPLADMPHATAASLAASMAASLNGDWRNRAVQVQNGVKRTDGEIAALVDKGYGLAVELADRALAGQPDSWRYAVLKAGLSYDRMQFRKLQKKQGDAAKEAEYRTAAFAAFENAAQRYAAAVTKGEEREDIGVFERWFGAAMGTSQLNFLNAEDLPTEGSKEDDQVERIRRAIAALPADSAFRHTALFARALGLAVSRSDPEVKPKLVKQALRIVGDHPAGASLRALDELYRDLVKDEIKLRLTLDGPDRVGTGGQFGMLLSLRFTNSVDRETGGFSKYLQTNAFVRVGRQYQEVNFREKLQKNIENALGKAFTVESIGYFDPFMPARGVTESGQDGWMEKPMAYVVVSRKDPATDRIPQITMDMQFEDQTGPVTLVLPSNTPALAVADKGESRPCKDLRVTLVVDPRDARDGEKDRTIRLEVICRGKGVAPDLRDVLDGIDQAIDGYTVAEKGVEARPTLVLQEGDASTGRFYWGPPKPPEGGYPEPDESGMYRLNVERSWVITYSPSANPGSTFRVPTLKPGVPATLEARYFSDMDLVPVSGGVVPVERRSLFVLGGIVALLVGALVGLALAWRRLRRHEAPAAAGFAIPDRVTPLSTVMTLRRLAAEHGGALGDSRRADLERDIALVEMKCFGPGDAPQPTQELSEILARWAKSVR